MEPKLKLVTLIGLYLSFVGCVEDTREPINNDRTAPKTVSSIIVRNTPGGAVIKYTLPNDNDLLYVEAKYKIKNGKQFKVRSSIYADSVNLVGFGDTDKYKIDLYTVDRGENRSEALQVEIEPLEPAVKTIFKTLKLKTTFGGVNVAWKNEGADPIVITILGTKGNDENGELLELEKIYTETTIGSQSIRGFNSDSIYHFTATLRDRWDNYSMIKEITIKPLYEEELDKSKFNALFLPGDTNQSTKVGGKSDMHKLWDGKAKFSSERTRGTAFEDGQEPGGDPGYYYTFDLGVHAKLSRFNLKQYFSAYGSSKWIYNSANYELFEVWGASELDRSGAWNKWTKLKYCEVIKPSRAGNPKDKLGVNLAEDFAKGLVGDDWDFSAEVPVVRYIRIKVLKGFAGTNTVGTGEITFWGAVQNEKRR